MAASKAAPSLRRYCRRASRSASIGAPRSQSKTTRVSVSSGGILPSEFSCRMSTVVDDVKVATKIDLPVPAEHL
jgi:hypothetical protein